MSVISEQRKFLNDTLIHDFASMVPIGSGVYDIGKSTTWSYNNVFSHCVFKTVDRDPRVVPDIVHDFEDGPLFPRAKAIVLNGVFEQCNNPFSLIENVGHSLEPDGLLLAGLAGTRMSEYGSNDKWRITHAGVFDYLKRFKLEQIFVFPEYYYAICRKP